MTPEQQTLVAVAEALTAFREELAEIKAEISETKGVAIDAMRGVYDVSEIVGQTYRGMEGVGSILGAIYQNTIPEDLKPPMTPGRRFVMGLLQNPAFAATIEAMGVVEGSRHLESLIDEYDASLPQLTLVDNEDPPE